LEKKRLVLAGGGHAHMHILNNYVRLKKYSNITLVSDGIYQIYSGMVSAYIEDIYKFDEISFNLWKLCERANIDFIDSRVVGIDADKNLLHLSNGNSLEYDVVSFDIGSETNTHKIKNANTYGYKIKPLINLKKIKATIAEFPSKNVKTVIIGAGAAGYEIALALDNYIHRKNKLSKIILMDSNSTILSSFQRKVQKLGYKYLRGKRITFIANKTVKTVNENHILTEDNQTLYFDFLIWATGVRSNSIFLDSMLATDNKGFLKVDDKLQHIYYKNMFGAGDCISIKNHEELAKAGVYPVKQGPVLVKNLENYINNKPLYRFKPSNTYLKIISTGNKKSILEWKKICFKGKIVWRLKDRIDRDFMNRARDTK